MTYILNASASTIAGRRKRNEDAYVLDPDLGLFAVIDGMGGYAGGEVASSLAARTIAGFFLAIAEDPEATWPYALDDARTIAENRVDAAIRLANRRIRQRREGVVLRGEDDEFAGYALRDMGATVAMITLGPGGAVVGHLGDSRVYRLRGRGADGWLAQLTRDHSLYEQLLASGADLPPLEEFPHSNIVTRALGPVEDERPELARFELLPGDRFLLCSDGLSGVLGPEVLREFLSARPLHEVSEALVEAAYEAGSRDNITVIVVDVDAPARAGASRSRRAHSA
ncbi:MAG: protein phosphatase 2C domain-containing protein [Nannocystaceae bacterium]